jgi:hypothetical protein
MIIPSFGFWIKLCALCPVFFLLLFVGVFFPHSKVVNLMVLAGISFFVPLCAAGAVMGFFLVLKRLFFRCPFCSAKSPVVAGDKRRLWIECPDCGLISGTYLRFPPLTYRIEKESEGKWGADDAGEDV